MNQGKFTTEEEIRKFLLGQMTEAERTAFEERFIAADAELFDEIRVVEDELIEAYLRGRLTPGDAEAFERSFLASGPRRQRVELTRAMFAKLDDARRKVDPAVRKTGFWISLTSLFKNPQFAFGAAFALVAVVFGVWFFAFRAGNENEIVRVATPTPTATSTPPAASPTPPDVNQNLAPPINKPVNDADSNKVKPTPSPKEPPRTVVATLALFAGNVRGGGRASQLDLAPETKGVSMQLNLDSRDYQNYRAEVVDADGNIVLRSGKIAARGSRVTTYFPTEKLSKGDYLVRLYGFNAVGEEESAADFQFRVNRR